MICRLRAYGSGEEAVQDLLRLHLGQPPSITFNNRMQGLFVEGGYEEVRSFCERAQGWGAPVRLSEEGQRPRACVMGDICAPYWEHLMMEEEVRKAVRSYRSMGAPPVMMPHGQLEFQRPLVMGILNVTPDSFSDGIGYVDTPTSVRRALTMVEEGADIIDIGGESTRPGAPPVALEEELRRTIPVIQEIATLTDIPLSIDTRKTQVARAAIAAGASIVNDVTGLQDESMIDLAVQTEVPVILMHMLGDPMTMQAQVGPDTYEDVVADIMWRWDERMETAERRGLERHNIILDPGIGFGKLVEHNLEILDRLRELRCAGRPLLVGSSRKAFLGHITGEPVERRLGGSLAAAALAILNGASIIRVHDVRETVGSLLTLTAIRDRIKI